MIKLLDDFYCILAIILIYLFMDSKNTLKLVV